MLIKETLGGINMLNLDSFVISVREFFLLSGEGDSHFDSNRKYYVIPKYQREYKWTPEKVKTLISDINNREKFLGNIILNKVSDYYEIVDGQQRITTLLLILIALYNKRKISNDPNESEEQRYLSRYLYKDSTPILINESIGDYFHRDGNSIHIEIADKNDIYYQKKTFTTLYDIIFEQLNGLDIEHFQNKVLDSKVLVLIGDTQGNRSDSIEDIFLDINFKSQLLEVDDIFKGYCFKNYPSVFHDELKQHWTKVRKYIKEFEKIGYTAKDTCAYIYNYLLSRPETYRIPSSLSFSGKHYLENKGHTETKQLLLDMGSYGEHIMTIKANLDTNSYIFDDLCSNAERYSTDTNNHKTLKLMLQKIMLNTSVQFYKFPIFMVFHYLMKNDALKAEFTYEDLKKFVSNYYAYTFFFISSSKNKSKTSIDHTIFTELYKIDSGTPAGEVVSGIINATKKLRKQYLDEYVQFINFHSNQAYSLYSLMDNYRAADNYLSTVYDFPDYNIEHLIVHDNTNSNITWQEDENQFTFSLKQLLGCSVGNSYKSTQYKKATANYLIIPSLLNESLGQADIVTKINLIKNYYDRNHLNVPKHIATILSHIETQPEYSALSALKGQKKTKEEILSAYSTFVDSYFNDHEQRELYEKLEHSLRQAFQNN